MVPMLPMDYGTQMHRPHAVIVFVHLHEQLAKACISWGAQVTPSPPSCAPATAPAVLLGPAPPHSAEPTSPSSGHGASVGAPFVPFGLLLALDFPGLHQRPAPPPPPSVRLPGTRMSHSGTHRDAAAGCRSTPLSRPPNHAHPLH
jgi:hypothetical protein